MLPYYIDKENRLFLHGGFSHEKGVQEDHVDNLCLDRLLWKEAYLGNPGQDVRFSLYKEIYIGNCIKILYTYQKWFLNFNSVSSDK